MRVVKENPKISLGVVFLISQVVGIVAWVLCLIWATNYPGGYPGPHNMWLKIHMFFMPFFGIFLTGNGIVLFRLLHMWQTYIVKYLHFALHTVCLIGIIIGFASIVTSRNSYQPPIKHFITLHSWLGLVNFVVYMLHFLISCAVYLIPAVSQESRQNFAGTHAFIGVINLLLAVTTACIGISERTILSIPNLPELPPQTMIAYWAGFGLIAFAANILYIVVNPYFEWETIGEL